MTAISIFSSTLLWSPLPLFLLQVLLILVLVRLLGRLLHAIRQPMVIGEIIAGVLLGPSVFGYIPGFTDTMFPPASIDFLTLFSSVGLCFFMFFLGLEVDPSFMLQSWRTTLPIACVSMSIPFVIGVGVANWLFTLEPQTEQSYNHTSFLLFIGTIFSFSAFPVLARILDSTKLISSPVGIQALSIAALEDVVAWCVLALIISYSNNGPPPGSAAAVGQAVAAPVSAWNSLFIFIILVCFISILLLIIRPLLSHIYHTRVVTGQLDINSDFIPYLFFGFLICSWFTETLGIHAFFGSFLFGCILPKEGDLIPILAPRIELLIVHIFLPIYFANSGMKTQLQTLSDIRVWGITFTVIILASIAKVSSVTLASKLVLSIRKERIQELLEEIEREEDDTDSEDENEDFKLKLPRPELRKPPSSAATTTNSNSDSSSSEQNSQEDHPGEVSMQMTGGGGGQPPSSSTTNITQIRVSQHHLSSENEHSIDNIDRDDEEDDHTPVPKLIQTRTRQPSNVPSVVGNNNNGNNNNNSNNTLTTTTSSTATPTHRMSLTPLPSHHSAHSSMHRISSSSSSINDMKNGGGSSGGGGGTGTPGGRDSSQSNSHSHHPRIYSIPDLSPDSFVPDSDQDEFGLDIKTGLPLISEDQVLIDEFRMDTWSHCLTLGVLLNSRGLVALIVLNIGLDKGIIGPKIFSMMLFMSLVCTCCTSPIIYVLYGKRWMAALGKMKTVDETNQMMFDGDTGFDESALREDDDLISLRGADSPLTTTNANGALFTQEYQEQLAGMMAENRRVSQQAIMNGTAGGGGGVASSPMNTSSNEQPPQLQYRPSHVRKPSTQALDAPLLSSPHSLSTRAHRRSIDIDSASSSPATVSGSYIPPDIMARIHASSSNTVDSTGTSPDTHSTMMNQPHLGLQTPSRGANTGGGFNRFAAPQLASVLSSSPRLGGGGDESGRSTPSIVAQLRRQGSTLLGSSPSQNIPPAFSSQAVGSARSISTRNLLAGGSILHQRAAERAESRAESKAASRAGSGRSTPRASTTTAAGSYNRVSSPMMTSETPRGAISTRGFAASSRSTSNAISGGTSVRAMSPATFGSVTGNIPFAGRSFSPSTQLMGQTPVSPQWIPQQALQSQSQAQQQLMSPPKMHTPFSPHHQQQQKQLQFQPQQQQQQAKPQQQPSSVSSSLALPSTNANAPAPPPSLAIPSHLSLVTDDEDEDGQM